MGMQTTMVRRQVYAAVFKSPIGPLTVAVSERGVAGVTLPREGLPVDIRNSTGHDGVEVVMEKVPDRTGVVMDSLGRFFDGDKDAFAGLPLDPQGTPFQLKVWEACARVPFGETATYGDLAAAAGRPLAARAVGGAMNRNPLPIVVPCHRIVGSGGSLTGYGGGLGMKEWLLAHERGEMLAPLGH